MLQSSLFFVNSAYKSDLTMRLLSPKAVLVLSIAFALLATGCQKRYWYRIKLRSQQTHSVKVRILNLSPHILNGDFELEMLNACNKQLQKEGFQVLTKDSTQYQFELVMKLDTFNANIIKDGVKSDASGEIEYKVKPIKSVGFILLETRMWVTKSNSTRFDICDDLYFFDQPRRDRRRSRGVVRFMIRVGNDYGMH
ncbi:MAG: hypothetical protein MUE96_10305 [Bacteroidia bacterium]|nr:hypothetical protein [Bacteroidia bacterium]